MRQAAKSTRPEDIGRGQDSDPEAIAPERTHIDLGQSSPQLAEDIVQADEWPTPETPPPRKSGSGILTLILIAIMGMAIGFIAVMLI